jgi:hypothetical protein
MAAPTSSATPSLALPGSDYPRGSTISTLPATNSIVDQYLHPAHRSSFEQLHRVDGLGWLQFGVWHFTTGRAGAAQTHSAIFGYGVNLFHGAGQASRAVSDVKLRTKPFRVAHLAARFYRSSDVKETLVFVFFAYKSIEVEAYYEYDGVAPAAAAQKIRKSFSRQRSHLAARARALSLTLQTTPTPTSTRVPSATSTATPVPTATAVPVATATATTAATSTPEASATARPTATLTPTPGPTGTSTPVVLAVAAQIEAGKHTAGDLAIVDVHVTSGSQPVGGATVQAIFHFWSGEQSCQGTSDASGQASCSVTIPDDPSGTRVEVDVTADADGAHANAQAAFIEG